MTKTGSLNQYVGTMTLTSAGATVDIPFHQFLQSIEVEITSGGSWTGTVVLFDNEGDFLEKIVIAAGLDRMFDMQWGWALDDTVQRTFKGSILHYQPEFLPNGIALTLELAAAPVLTAVADKRIRSFKEGLRASEIVQQIADDRGWMTTDLSGRTTIEPTEPPLETPFNSRGESDIKFIKEQIVQQAVNQQGEGSYLFRFDESGSVHFRTPNYLQPVTHLVRYLRDGTGDLISFSPSDNSLFGTLMGGGNSVFAAAASSQGGQSQVNSIGAGGVAESPGAATNPVDSASRPSFGQGVNAYVNMVARTPEELERAARARFDTFRRHAYKARAVRRGDHRAVMSDYLNIEYVLRTGALHYLSGLFQIFKIKHTLGVGQDWVTEYELLRSGVENLPGAEAIQTQQVIDPPGATAQDGGGIDVEPG